MRDEQGWADFEAELGAPLRRQAYLLTGSAEKGARIGERALAEVGRKWDRLGGRGPAEEQARRLVLSAALRERAGVPERELSRVGTALPADDPAEAVWRALAGLPPRRRAVLVLRYDEGLSDVAAGGRLGIPPMIAAAEAAAGLATLRSLLRRRGAPEDLLPATLATLRDPGPLTTPTDPVDPAPPTSASTAASAPGGGSGVVGVVPAPRRSPEERPRDRRKLVVGGVAVAVVAVAAAVLVPVLSGGGDEPAAAAPDPVPAAAAQRPGELAWAARGPLSSDTDLLRGAWRAWRDGVPARQRPADAAVLYAGAPDGPKVVLLQGTDGTGQTWLAEVVDGALATTAPLGRAVPLLAVPARDQVRLLPPPGAGVLVGTTDRFRPLTLDADGLSEPVAAGEAVVTRDGTVLGSGSVSPGKLTPVTGPVEVAAGTLGLGPGAAVRAVWYGDGTLVGRRLGGPVTVAAAGPDRTTKVKVRSRPRTLTARTYEVTRGGDRYLAAVVRLDGKPVCVDVAPAAAKAPVLVARCIPAGSADGVLLAVAGAGIRTVRASLAGRGLPPRPVTVAGSVGRGMSGLARIPAGLTSAGTAEARSGGGTVLARVTVPAYRGPRT